MNRYIPPSVDVASHCHAGYVTECGLLVLQRRAFTTSREAIPGGLGNVLITYPAPGCITVEMSTPRGSRRETVDTEAQADRLAAKFAGDLLGTTLTPAPFTAAYMYQPRPSIGAGSDLIITPLIYQPGTDTIRTARNICVATFPDGAFASARIYDDAAGSDVWPHIENALAQGFPHLDRQEGDDHCKRRLAWLAGATWLDAADKPLRCAVVGRSMTRADEAGPA
jgi:hypothetical protein